MITFDQAANAIRTGRQPAPVPWHWPELPALLVSHHRPGFYMRVTREGRIQAGDPIIKTQAGPSRI